MERNHTQQETRLLQLAAQRFGADARFTYVNRKEAKVVTLTLSDALDACRYIVDESDDEVMRMLENMHAMTEKLTAARQAKLAQQVIGERRT